MQIDVSIIIVNYNTSQLLFECIASIEEFVKGVSYEIIVVDNASVDGSREMIKKNYSHVTLIENQVNKGFGAANNIGARAAKGRYLFLFNSDALMVSDCVTPLFLFLEKNKNCAMVGPRVLLFDKSRQPKICGDLPAVKRIFYDTFFLSRLFSKTPFFKGMYVDHPIKRVTLTGWISGVCMLIRTEVFKAVGGFDETIFLYCEDIDLCRRIKKKEWAIAHIDDYPIVHKSGGSAKSDDDIIRNSQLQQKFFLLMLGKNWGPKKMLVVKVILFIGLLLRAAAGMGKKVMGRENGDLLFETSTARIKTLVCG